MGLLCQSYKYYLNLTCSFWSVTLEIIYEVDKNLDVKNPSEDGRF
jgi:hypothetical protein